MAPLSGALGELVDFVAWLIMTKFFLQCRFKQHFIITGPSRGVCNSDDAALTSAKYVFRKVSKVSVICPCVSEGSMHN